MLRKIGGKIAFYPIWVLHLLGEAGVAVAAYIIKNFFGVLRLFLKYLWDRTVKIRHRLLSVLQYVCVIIASPFVKLAIDFGNMRRDIRNEKREKGLSGAFGVSLRYFLKITVGRRGLGVTAFNLLAPALSVVFLLNVVSYATSATYALKLTVNGEFLGYVESEQVFLDAEAIVLQRVNFYGSNKNIDVYPEYSIEKIGSSEMLTKYQVANAILKNSGFSLKLAYGFYIDRQFYGAVIDNSSIERTVNSLLDAYRSDIPDEEISFINKVEWSEADMYLAESIVEPDAIIRMITRTDGDRPFLPIAVTRTEEYDVEVPYDTEYISDTSRYVTSSRETQQGENGVNHITARVSYVNGEEISRVTQKVETVSPPVNRVISTGTLPLPSGEVSTQSAEYGKFIWPTLSRGYISCNYGQDGSRWHSGIDIAGEGYGAPIFAADSGTVVFSGNKGDGYGNYVIIQHENGLRTLYGHCSTLSVKYGDKVIQGQQIANVGSTGYSTGPHLHFEVIQGNTRVNPNGFL